MKKSINKFEKLHLNELKNEIAINKEKGVLGNGENSAIIEEMVVDPVTNNKAPLYKKNFTLLDRIYNNNNINNQQYSLINYIVKTYEDLHHQHLKSVDLSIDRIDGGKIDKSKIDFLLDKSAILRDLREILTEWEFDFFIAVAVYDARPKIPAIEGFNKQYQQAYYSMRFAEVIHKVFDKIK